MDFLFQLLCNAINFLTQLGKCLLSLYHSKYTTCTVTENHKNTISEQNLSYSSETKRIHIDSLEQKTVKSSWNAKKYKT